MVMTYIVNHLDEPLDLHQPAAMTDLGGAQLHLCIQKAAGYVSYLCYGRTRQYSSKHVQKFLQACRTYSPELRIFQAVRLLLRL